MYCDIHGLLHILLPVPTPSVSVTHNGGSTLYAGTVLTLTCTITVTETPISVMAVTSTWTLAGGIDPMNGSGITVNPAMLDSGITYISTVVINTLIIDNAGTYTCKANVTPVRTIQWSIITSDTAEANIALVIESE